MSNYCWSFYSPIKRTLQFPNSRFYAYLLANDADLGAGNYSRIKYAWNGCGRHELATVPRSAR